MNEVSTTTVAGTSQISALQIDEFTIDRPAELAHHGMAEVLTWRANGENAEMARRDGGSDYGRVLVRLSVDGQYDIVEAYSGRTADVDALDMAIVAMQEVRDRLVQLGHTRSGACMATADWGRCEKRTGHDAAHQYPAPPPYERGLELATAGKNAGTTE